MRFVFACCLLLAAVACSHGHVIPTQPSEPPVVKPPRDICARLPEADRPACYEQFPGGQVPAPTQN